MRCDDCQFYTWDEEYEEYVCDVNMDEDDYARMQDGQDRECPYWRSNDEYQVVRHQM